MARLALELAKQICFLANSSLKKQQLTAALAELQSGNCLPIGYRSLIRQRAA